MILCFIVEFCNRWALNTINSRYGAFLLDKFNVSSTTFSYIMCGQSLWLCFQQGYLYSLIVHKWNCPILVLSLIGMIIEVIAYTFIAFAPSVPVSIVASTLLYIGFAFAVPTSSTIISVWLCYKQLYRPPIDLRFRARFCPGIICRPNLRSFFVL